VVHDDGAAHRLERVSGRIVTPLDECDLLTVALP
jgi:hypothetical protein